MNTQQKFAALRAAMAEAQLDAYLVPSADPHQSEYFADHWAAREWLTGFTGSAGTLVVTLHEARLWTDSRYWTQAASELAGSGVELMRDRHPGVPTPANWLSDHLLDGQTVGVDGRTYALAAADRLANRLLTAGLRLSTDHDLVSPLWANRPPIPAEAVYEHTPDWSGEHWHDRLLRFRDWVAEAGLDYYTVTALDEVAWLLNARGSDVAFNPLAIAYLTVGRRGDCYLFTPQPNRFAAWNQLLPDGLSLELQDYGHLAAFLRQHNAEDADLGLDPATASVALAEAAGRDRILRLASPVPAWKAVKNDVALGHLREAMCHDAVALLRFRRWLDEAVPGGGVTEHTAGRQLADFRARYAHYVSDSFATIVGYQGNGAIVHYRAPEHDSATLAPEGILLVDSGGQYRSGTTDITRTFALGQPTDEQRRNFTLVLRGMIELSGTRFPAGTTGVQLDAIARRPLWGAGLDYGHGTGHGVGYFLNVHEGPAGILTNPKSPKGQYPLEAGLVLSNEPGYYAEGRYGIRCENLVAIRPAPVGEAFLEFETLTLFPFERALTDAELLGPAARGWLDDYHAYVLERVAPLLAGAELDWLQDACRPL